MHKCYTKNKNRTEQNRTEQNRTEQNRTEQNRTEQIEACHILLETQISGKWVVLDPSLDLAFEKPDGSLASFVEVKKNWDYYSRHLPPDYSINDLNYENVRYTNWSKYPIITPAIKSILSFFIGKRTDEICLSMYFLNQYQNWLIMTLLFYLILVIITIRFLQAN
ncbi:MAG: hypothetical protein HY094_01980 [Candidatus Melainabacteria bacterium]|nr:hypothetical protein [Candidatus Melainabacteria bacterium]